MKKALKYAVFATTGLRAARGLFSLVLMGGLAALCASGLTVPAEGAAARAPVPSDLQAMTYEVYAGGINAVTAQLDIRDNPKDKYSMELDAQTKGFLGKLVPWSGTFETNGKHLKDGDYRPALHKSTAKWKDEADIKEYVYGADGSFVRLHSIEAGVDVTPKKIDGELTQGTIDALTATMRVMKTISKNGKCEGESDVFDGDRRFKLVFAHEAEDQLAATDYNVYSGPAARCRVEVVPVAGPWHKKPRGWMSIQEQGREKGSLPTVWMAQLSGTGPAVPVKMRIKTDYGTLFMHLVHYEGDGKVLGLASAKTAQN